MQEELAPAPCALWDQSLLAPIIEINERMLECLHLSARACRSATLAAGVTAPARGTAGADGNAQAPTPALVVQLLHDWCALDAAAQRRLAHCPYLLLDAGFGEPGRARWPGSAAAAVHEAAPARAERRGFLADEAWLALVRRTLLLGWHLARAQPLAARVLLGMSPAGIECIAASRLSDLDELAGQGAGQVAPRWEQQPQVWRQLLRASHAPLPQLRWTQLRGLQLLAGDGARGGLALGAGT